MPGIQACVLAAGKGTRMGGDRPKVLFEARGKPLIEWVLGALSEAGVDDVVVVVGYRKDDVVSTLPTGVRWVEQSPQLGTGHAVRCARGVFPGNVENIIVTYGDMPLVTAATYRCLIEARAAFGAAAVFLAVPVTPDSRFGRVVRDSASNVLRIVEYKDATPEERRIGEGNAGVYCFAPRFLWNALEKIKNDNAQGEYYLTDVVDVLISEGGRVEAILAADPLEGTGVNTPAELGEAEKALAIRESRAK
ncbi:MAG: NTP transferase domain-containing protein [Planctomycetota bacterium]|jgi:bifunctional UDP-N-acetylglucosamine pyrophosphorylase/glucosamine-1-phosphate N-acetyltransferase|nr:NTP transferase domain-containing protein [Planctomycetota bacterium]